MPPDAPSPSSQGRARRVVVVNHLSLDGFLQGPARNDEDTRDGFRLGLAGKLLEHVE